nr:MAG TPA: hypothetical protein [Caudoviricetes sp.]
MTRYSGKKRRQSTIIRDNAVHEIYRKVCREIGPTAPMMPRGYLYGLISEKTGLCIKTIAFILNHTFRNSGNNNLTAEK